MKNIMDHSRIMLLILFFVSLSVIESNGNVTGENKISLRLNDLKSPGMLIYQDDTLSREEKKLLKKQQRAQRKEQAAAQRKERVIIDNPNHADYILLGDNLPRGKPVLEAISGRVPGMSISGNSVMIHGPSSFYGGMTPMFIVDDIEVSLEFANGVTMEDIERIEIFTGSSAAIYGSRVGNGVISIYTKFYYNNKTQ